MKRQVVVLALAGLLGVLLVRPVAASTLHGLRHRLHKERALVRFCKAHRVAVAHDPKARRACGRAWFMVPRLRRDIGYLLRKAKAQRRHRVVNLARHFLGVPYVWGGSSPSGFDCSGLVQYVYRHVGVHLGRTTYAQHAEGRRVSMRHLRPGDVVFNASLGHEALYIGGGAVIEAPRTGLNVRIASVGRFASARRFLS